MSDAYDYRLTTQIVARAIDATARDHVLLHAAGVAFPDGRVFALVAASGSGKTTAARVLCAAGLGYVTDELVACDDTLTVVPFAKPLSQLGRDGDDVKRQFSPDELGLGHSPSRLKLAGVVLLDRRPGLAESSARRLDLAEAVAELMPHTCGLPQLDAPLQRLTALASAVSVFRVTYGDASQLADALVALPDTWSAVPTVTAGGPDVWRRGMVKDAVVIGDVTMLLKDATPITLGPLGRAIWEWLEEGATIAELEAHLGDDAPPDAPARLAEALRDLAALGVVLPPGSGAKGAC